MTTISVIFIMAFFVSLAATRVAIMIAPSLNMLDKPDAYRKTHAEHIPMLGGPAIYIAILIPILLLGFFFNLTTVSEIIHDFTGPLLGILSGATVALALGLLDDIFNLKARWKLLGQLMISVMVYRSGLGIYVLSNPWGGSLDLGLLSFPITLLWFMGCMNAVNLMDGLDGLASGICLFAGLTLFLVSLHFNNILGMVLMAVMSGAILGFLVFNFPPARIFLGDSGSMLLGYLVAAFSLLGASRKAEAAVALFIPIVALGLPIMDTAVAIVRRWYKHLPISTPDRKHIHHKLVSMGYSKQRAVLMLYGASVILGASAVLISFGRNEVVVFVIAALVMIAFVCIRIFSGVRLMDVRDKLKQDNERRHSLNNMNQIVEYIVSSIEEADNIQQLWEACSEGFEELEIDVARLTLNSPADLSMVTRLWKRPMPVGGGPSNGDNDGWAFHLTLRAGDTNLGRLELEKYNLVIPEIARLIDRLRKAMEKQIPLCREYKVEEPHLSEYNESPA